MTALDAHNLEEFQAIRVLVVGDIMLDRYWFGDVDRISPEAPVPVVLVNEVEERMGGAGNVAANITALGGSATLVCVTGNDTASGELETLAHSNNISAQLIRDSKMPTCIKQRVISRNQQLIRADFEGRPGEQQISELHKLVSELLTDHDVMILSDYGKGSLAQSEKLINIARNAGIPVLVDPKGSDFSCYQGASLITPNFKELELVAGRIENDAAMQAAAASLIDKHTLGGILVTLSERGMMLFRDQAKLIHSPARSREVYDVSGAGDTVIAVMALCLGAGYNDESTLQIANSAAGVVVSKLGTASANREEVLMAISRDNLQ